MLEDISYDKATLKSKGKMSIHLFTSLNGIWYKWYIGSLAAAKTQKT